MLVGPRRPRASARGRRGTACGWAARRDRRAWPGDGRSRGAVPSAGRSSPGSPTPRRRARTSPPSSVGVSPLRQPTVATPRKALSAISGTATTLVVPIPSSSRRRNGLHEALRMIRGSRSPSMPTSSGTIFRLQRGGLQASGACPRTARPRNVTASVPVVASHSKMPALLQPTMRGSASLTMSLTAAASVAAESSWASASSAPRRARALPPAPSSSARIRSRAGGALRVGREHRRLVAHRPAAGVERG